MKGGKEEEERVEGGERRRVEEKGRGGTKGERTEIYDCKGEIGSVRETVGGGGGNEVRE